MGLGGKTGKHGEYRGDSESSNLSAAKDRGK